jgi:hypothetical protein
MVEIRGTNMSKKMHQINTFSDRSNAQGAEPTRLLLAAQSGVDTAPFERLFRAVGFREPGTVAAGIDPATPVLQLYDRAEALARAREELFDGSNVHLLLVYRDPTRAVAEAIAEDDAISPEEAATEWLEQTEPLLALFRGARRRILLVESRAASTHPEKLMEALNRRLGLSLEPAHAEVASNVEEDSSPIDPVLLLIAERACHHVLEVRQLVSEVEASALPLGNPADSPTIDLSSTVQAYREKSQVAPERAAIKKLEAEIDRLKTELQEKQNKNRELEERAEAQSKDADRIADMEEENELLLMQLHQVQEELESYFLQNQDLERKFREVQAEKQEFERKARQARNMLSDVHGSLSWKITAPIRWLLRALLGR